MVQPMAYRNTRTDARLSDKPLHDWSPRGYAYEHDTHLIHMYGSSSALWTFTTGLATVSEAKGGEIRQWMTNHFGAQDVVEMNTPAGSVVEGYGVPVCTTNKRPLRP
jgi:hypothetical protein